MLGMPVYGGTRHTSTSDCRGRGGGERGDRRGGGERGDDRGGERGDDRGGGEGDEGRGGGEGGDRRGGGERGTSASSSSALGSPCTRTCLTGRSAHQTPGWKVHACSSSHALSGTHRSHCVHSCCSAPHEGQRFSSRSCDVSLSGSLQLGQLGSGGGVCLASLRQPKEGGIFPPPGGWIARACMWYEYECVPSPPPLPR